ncbi:PAS domain S-box protein [Halobaculum limi]|uniref:PAS domain S-box protein n=1 Tax=Halobaculum limi TaxID=3031916 RepID=UPI0024060FFC|nr:PAS domain S-box protein [Halobaculum sp. YSMS11]
MPASDDAIRVLHVDDDPDFAELVATFLERERDQITVDSACNAAEARSTLGEDSPAVDCVVSDHDMSDENGIEFLRSVRTEYPDLPFILFTGKGSEEVASEAISAGVTDYLQKGGGRDQYELLANRIVNAVDATRSQRMLIERTRRLETLIDNLPGMIYRCRNEPPWPMETVDGEVRETTGYDAEILERNEVVWGEEVIHPDDRDHTWNAVQEALDSDDDTFELTYRIQTPDGETRWMWERGRSVDDDDDGSVAVIEGFITDVTERKQRERRLERTTARLEALFEESPDMINVHDDEGYFVDANPRLCAETGYTKAELTEMQVWDIDQEIDAPEARALWDEMKPGDRHEREGVYERRDGSTFPVEVNIRRLDLDGEERFLVSSRDISERKRRDRKLKRLRERARELTYTQTTEETARLATEAADEIIGADLSGVHLVDDTGERMRPIVMTNTAWEALGEQLAYDRSAPLGTRAHLAWDVFQTSAPTYISSVSASDRLSEDSPAESVVLHSVGDHGLFIASSHERDAFSATDRLLVEILADTLEAALDRVAREESSRERERSLELLHDATRDLIHAESADEIADHVVAAAADILGFSVTTVRFYDEDEGLVPVAESDAVTEVLPDRTTFAPETESLNWDAFEAGEVRVYDDIERVDGSVDAGTGLRSLMILPMGHHGTLAVGETTPNAFDASDEFLARILSTAAETALDQRERRDELRDRNERLEEFANVVSHDLRNPLSVAKGHLSLLDVDPDNDHYQAVQRAHERMEALIEDLLALAREDRDEAEVESVDLAATARDCWQSVETNGATLDIDTRGVVHADPRQLDRLVENLFRNAVVHGGDAVTVTVGDLPDGFYVEDDGVGIDPDRRESVFEPGYSTSDGGTGFGLRIVERVADRHGWTVDVAESDDGGARFEVTGVETNAT